MLQIIKLHKDKIQLVVGSLALFCLWFYGYENFLALDKTNTGLDWQINRFLGLETAAWFSLFGYEAKVITYSIYPHLMYLDSLPIMSIDTPCNGLPILYLFAAFILVYPGTWKRKAVFIPVGLLVIHVLNMIRIISLSYISIYSPDYFDFNHKYLFQIIVYSLVFTLWFFWILYGRDPKMAWIQGFKEFVTLKFLKKLGQLI